MTDQTLKAFKLSHTLQIQVRGSEKKKKKGTSKVSNNEVKEQDLCTVFLQWARQNVSLLIFILIEAHIAVDPAFKSHSGEKEQEKG